MKNNKPLNTKIYKKICNKIRVVEQNNQYVVQSRNSVKDEWNEYATFTSLKKALRLKHNLTHLVIRDLGLCLQFKERRINKVNKFRRRLNKKLK